MTWYLWLAAASGTAGFVSLVLRGLWRVHRTVNRIEYAVPILEDIAKEFHPNSGTSLRDRVNRLESNDFRMETKINRIEQFVKPKRRGW